MLIAEEEKFNGQKVLQQVRNAKREIRDLIYLIHLGIPGLTINPPLCHYLCLSAH